MRPLRTVCRFSEGGTPVRQLMSHYTINPMPLSIAQTEGKDVTRLQHRELDGGPGPAFCRAGEAHTAPSMICRAASWRPKGGMMYAPATRGRRAHSLRASLAMSMPSERA